MAFKFLHAADIHLDSPMAGLLGRGDLPAEIILGCTRRAFEAMVQLAIDEDVAFIVIAGDLYDGDWKNHATGLFFAEQMRRLDRPCFLLRGNHDAQSVITKALRLPSNVREFSSRTCETFEMAEHGVALHGHSFPNRAVPEDLSAGYKDRRTGMLNIGVLHTSADRPGDHAVYAECSVASLALKAMTIGHSAMCTGTTSWNGSPGLYSPGTCRAATSGRPAPKVAFLSRSRTTELLTLSTAP